MTRFKRYSTPVWIALTGMPMVFLLFMLWTVPANTSEITTVMATNAFKAPPVAEQPRRSATTVPAVIPVSVAPAISERIEFLNGPQMYALGMIETGNDDRAIGRAGEISRYQIMPLVWNSYSRSREYQNSEVSLEVARKHWLSLYSYFKRKTNREPTGFDMYVLWNTRLGYYASKNFDLAKLHPVVRDRAQRFVNLVNVGLSREAQVAADRTRGRAIQPGG